MVCSHENFFCLFILNRSVEPCEFDAAATTCLNKKRLGPYFWGTEFTAPYLDTHADTKKSRYCYPMTVFIKFYSVEGFQLTNI